MNSAPSTLEIDANSGLIKNCRQHASPNQDARPAEADIELIVIHSISLPPGEYGNPAIEQFFCNQLDASEHPYYQQIHNLKVSAHILIKRNGSLIQFVPFQQRAWHAGKSCYRGRERCNDFSIGIELEGTDSDTFSDAQYEQLAGLVMALEKTYPGIKHDRITGHSDIAPGRKTDPGNGFDWQRLKNLLQVKA